MLLDLSRIRTAHERFERTYPPDALKADEEYTVVAPIVLEFDIYKDKQHFRLSGRVSSTLEMPCSRCLEPLRWSVDEPFELTYQPKAQNAGEGEREIHDEDFSSAFYDNDAIDLDQLIRERFEMSIPMKPLCGDDCKGLCPICGTNLNRGTCDCRRDWDDPRFAALKELQSGPHKEH